MKKSAGYLSLLIILFLAVSASGEEFEIIRITDNNYFDGNPKINAGGIVVWEAEVQGNTRDILVYDGVETRNLTDNDYDDRNPQISDTGLIALACRSNIFLGPGSPNQRRPSGPLTSSSPEQAVF